MTKLSLEEFRCLAAAADLVPVVTELAADFETPVSVLSRFADDPDVFLLESVEGGETVGRYSFIGIDPEGIFTIENGRPYFTESGRVRRELPFEVSPFEALRELVGTPRVAPTPELPPLFGGAIGFLGYEAVNLFEELPPPKTAAATPQCAMMLTDAMIVFDNVRHTLKIVVTSHPERFPSPERAYAAALRRTAEIEERLRLPSRRPAVPAAPRAFSFSSNLTREQFTALVLRAKQHIEAGDVIQIVLSQRFAAPVPAAPLDIYRALRVVNPSPYNFFLKLGGTVLAGSSPETLVRLSGRRALVRPIAGTRRRGGTPESDRVLAAELLDDVKERAEHLMLVDLGRNDLGRVAEPGSVRVDNFMHVEKYSHVMHLVSDVTSELAAGRDGLDLLKAVFPAGTLSGAPKIRAMELINELEPGARGAYGGAVGYVAYGGDLDFAITIRTVEIAGGRLTVQAGAGIVSDSDPDREYEETLNKAAALFQGVELAARGLDFQAE